MTTPRPKVRRALMVVALLLAVVAAAIYIRSRKHAQVALPTTTVSPCTGTKLTFIARYMQHGEWSGARLRLSDRTAPNDPARFVETTTLSMRIDGESEPWAALAHFAPPDTHPIGVEGGRWLIVENEGHGFIRVVDTKTNREIPGFFPKVKGKAFAGGRALRWRPGEIAVIDLASERELYHCPDCDTTRCAFGEASTNGRAIHCVREGPHVTPAEIIDVDDPSHVRAVVCTNWERTSPDDTYVLSLPSSYKFMPACTTNPFVSWRPTFAGTAKQVSPPVQPEKSRFDVAFCGGGELFFTYTMAGSGPNTISMFRGGDASLVSTTSGPEGDSLSSATIRGEMDQSGRYLAFFAERPNDKAETWLYRLDP